jgi:hypothetical protein
MVNITVKDLATNIMGIDLLNDSESFMLDLSDGQIDIQGGCGGNGNNVKFGPKTRPIIIIYSCVLPRPQA